MRASWAREVARGLLAEALSRRWAHVQGVAEKAERVAVFLALTTELWLLRPGCTTSAMRPKLQIRDFTRWTVRAILRAWEPMSVS